MCNRARDRGKFAKSHLFEVIYQRSAATRIQLSVVSARIASSARCRSQTEFYFGRVVLRVAVCGNTRTAQILFAPQPEPQREINGTTSRAPRAPFRDHTYTLSFVCVYAADWQNGLLDTPSTKKISLSPVKQNNKMAFVWALFIFSANNSTDKLSKMCYLIRIG